MQKTNPILGIFLIGLMFVLFSCDDNNKYSLGDFRIDIATIEPVGDNAYALVLDNGDRLWPAATDVRYLPKFNQRAIVNYTILSDRQGEFTHYVKVNDIWNVLTKKAIELNAMNADSIGNDPVKVNGIWVGGDYLNVDFMFNYGGIRPHAINLVENTLSSTASPDAIDLEFRHNSYESANTMLYEGFACFDLKPFRKDDVDSVALSIKVKDWDGEKKYDVVYKYNQASLSGVATQMPIPVITSNEYY